MMGWPAVSSVLRPCAACRVEKPGLHIHLSFHRASLARSSIFPD